MDSECLFYFWVYKKRSKTQFCLCCSISVEYEYCVLLVESRKQHSKKEKEKKSNNFQLPICVFSRSVLISQKWSLSHQLSASICVVCSHSFHKHKKILPKPFVPCALSGKFLILKAENATDETDSSINTIAISFTDIC